MNSVQFAAEIGKQLRYISAAISYGIWQHTWSGAFFMYLFIVTLDAKK